MAANKKILIPVISLVVITIGIAIWQKTRLVRYAKRFIGMDEIGDNMGWTDPNFEKKLRAVGWTPGASWCVFFVKAMWADVYPELKTKLYNGKKLLDYVTGNSQSTYTNMQNLQKQTGWFKVTGVPKPGDMVVWQDYNSSGGATSSGHVGIVTKVKGDTFNTIEGNAQPLYSLVLTPKGYVKMGDLKEGDEHISVNGEKSFVEKIYPQGKRPIYEIVLNDLSKARCSDNHLWKVYDIEGKEFIFDTLTLKEKLISHAKYILPSLNNINFQSNELPIGERSIEFVNYIGDEECQCIKVTASDHLYITDNFIPTHNTSELGNTEETVNKKTHTVGEMSRKTGLRLKGFIRYTLA